MISPVQAEELHQTTSVEGMVSGVECVLDEETSITTCYLTLADSLGRSEEFHISLDTALAKGVVIQDAEGQYIFNEEMHLQPVSLDVAEILPFVVIIENIQIETNEETGISVVLVTMTDENGDPQTVKVDLGTALTLGLVQADGEGGYIVNEEMIGQKIEIPYANIIDDEDDGDEKLQPVAERQAEFFFTLIGMDYDTIQTYHENGVGYGVIAQACWLANAMGGDATTCTAILDAKQNKDYSTIVPPGETGETGEAEETQEDGPTSWGQFKKQFSSEMKGKNNGAVVSGHANEDTDETLLTTEDEGQNGNNGHGHDGNNGNKPDKDEDGNGRGHKK